MRIFVCLALLLLASCAPDGQKASPAQTAGNLRCFSITPFENHFKTVEEYPTCNDLCAQQGAACTGVTSAWSPPQSCEVKAISPAWGICRCCVVTK